MNRIKQNKKQQRIIINKICKLLSVFLMIFIFSFLVSCDEIINKFNPNTDVPSVDKDDDSDPSTETPSNSDQGNSNSGTESPSTPSQDDNNPGTETPSNPSQDDNNPGTETPSNPSQDDNNPGTETPSNPDQDDNNPGTEQPSKPDVGDTPIIYDDFQVHFLELGNYNAGDCTFIKAGDLDILIDAGSTIGSIPTLKKYINQYCKDGVLEYVIATHAHEDHIAGFTTDSGIFASYEVKTIIDFTRKNTTSKVSASYITYRDQEVAGGAKHYTASDCIKGTNGGQKKYQLTENISFEILDQKYYYSEASSENDYSVCTLFTRGEDHFLFTGDLELSGEESLAELNDLPKVKLFKAGHHGSKTSSNEVLLREIQPEYVAVCCCAGSSEYTRVTDNMFPTQDFINRVAVYTDKIYVTTMCDYTIKVATADSKGVKKGEEYMQSDSSSFKPMNGNIIFTYVEGVFSVNCSNNNTILKDTEWFNRTITLNGITRKMRTWPTASA